MKNLLVVYSIIFPILFKIISSECVRWNDKNLKVLCKDCTLGLQYDQLKCNYTCTDNVIINQSSCLCINSKFDPSTLCSTCLSTFLPKIGKFCFSLFEIPETPILADDMQHKKFEVVIIGVVFGIILYIFITNCCGVCFLCMFDSKKFDNLGFLTKKKIPFFFRFFNKKEINEMMAEIKKGFDVLSKNNNDGNVKNVEDEKNSEKVKFDKYDIEVEEKNETTTEPTIVYKPGKLANFKIAYSTLDEIKICIFNPNNCELKVIKSLKEHTSYINDIISLSNKHIISCSDDKSIRIFNSENEICKFIGHKQGIYRIIILKNGKYKQHLCSCSYDGIIRIWKIPSPLNNLTEDKKIIENEVLLLKPGKKVGDKVNSLVELPNGNIISAGINMGIKIWDLENNGKLIFTLTIPYKWVESMLLFKNTIIVGLMNGSISIYEIKENYQSIKTPLIKEIKNLHFTVDVHRVLKLNDKKYLFATCAKEATIYLFQEDYKFTKLKGHEGIISDIKELVYGNLLSVSKDKTMRLWNITKKNPSKNKILVEESNGIDAISIFKDQVWSKKNHHEFGKKFQKLIIYFLWLNNFDSMFCWIPEDIIYELFTYFIDIIDVEENELNNLLV